MKQENSAVAREDALQLIQF